MKVRGYRVFYIDHESGIKDLIDIIKNTTAIRIALVVKNGQLILNSSVNLKLLGKYVKRYSRELVFVSPDPSVVENVTKAGFKLYQDLNMLEKKLDISSSSFNNDYREEDKDLMDDLNEDYDIQNDELEVKKNIAVGSEDDNDQYTRKFNKESINNDNQTSLNSKKDNEYEHNTRKIKDNKNNNRNNRKKRISTFISVVLFLAIIGMAYFYFLYPTATIEIEPVIKTAKHQIEIAASIDANQIDWENNVLPLHETEVEINGQQEVATSGVRLIGDTKARGIVKFINERKENLQIPAGTIVMTENDIKFKTVEDIVIPKLKVDYLMDVPVGMKAGQAEVEVEALTKGSVGNVGIGRIKQLAKPIEQINIINPEPIRGGKDRQVSLVSEKDIEKAKELLNEKMKSKLITRVYQELGGNFRIIEDKIKFSEPGYSIDHEVGDEAETITVEGSITANGYLIKNNEIDRLVTKLFKNKLPNNVQLMSSGINIESVQLEEKGKSMYNILIGLNAPVIPTIDSDSLVKRLSGLNMADAQSMLEEMGDVDSYRISSQYTKLPNMGFAIKVVVKEPEEMKVFNIND